MINEAQQHLRDATQADHQRLEARMDILQRIATIGGRRALVQRFYDLHTQMEAALAPWLAELPGLAFEARRRSVQLAADLIATGGRARPQREAPIEVESLGEALGRMYVLEGSTLGGRVIRKAVAARGGDMIGLSFLDPHGDRVGERWKSFLAVLNAAARTPADLDAMASGAIAGFRHAELRLCEDDALV